MRLGVLRDQQSSECYANSWNENNYAPYAVPIKFGIHLRRRSAITPHKLKASTGIWGRSMYAGGLINHVTSDATNLANARVPKYTKGTLFLRVIAYILRRGHIGCSRI